MYGIEQYLVKWAVETLVKKYVNSAASAMDYVKLSGERITVSEIINACETFSMFSERRIVWVRDFKPLESDSARGFSKDEIKELAAYAEKSNDRTILIFFFGRNQAERCIAFGFEKERKSLSF